MLDVVNAFFVLCAVTAAIRDILCVRRDRGVRGVSLATGALFTLWPMWDVYYYASLGQYVSQGVCLVLACLRLTWLSLALRYR